LKNQKNEKDSSCKIKYNVKFLKISLLIFVIIFNSCSSDNIQDDSLNLENENFIENDSSFVSITEAKDIANQIFFSNKKMFSKGNEKKRVTEIKPVGTTEDKASYYIVNFEEGGFVIISSDKRMYPILAYSEKNNFDLTSENYPDLLVNWLFEQDKYVNDLRKGKIEEIFKFDEHWKINSMESRMLKSNKVNFASKTNSGRNYTLISSHGPLISTSWGQGVGYNNSAPNKSCSEYSNGRTPTGCVATAMSQIMKFHSYPNTYNWSIMPNRVYSSTSTSNGANEISRLMRDAGNSVGIDWGCDGSGADTEDAANALKNTFGYQSATYSNNYTNAISDIQSGFPVILKGGRTEDWVLFQIYKDGHAWVCDGYELAKVEVCAPAGRWGCTWRWVNLSSYHMNWGWNGSWNGWYNSLNNSVGDFSYKSGVIYNIRK